MERLFYDADSSPLPTRESTDRAILSATSLRTLAIQLADSYLERRGPVLVFLCACRPAFAMFLSHEIESRLTESESAEFRLCLWDHAKDELTEARKDAKPCE